ncbi:ABC transporter ATP-binding protein [Ramlibacter sp. G-1-2-2]|uniref:ABC transporter ATP-binding protein n=1 Tax=Ramlibacter agri TaxID=2728837 RepID=A0A848HA16_9BURK|nr:ABC transporter ATP-binding protein [Ramlibacter agri]NML47317.1 ABC transporter ATP-binding protein [Ramlibacter agri]
MNPQALVRVDGLSLEVAASGKRVVESVSFEVQPGELVGIVGESGSGKTMVARALMRLEPVAIRRAGGSIAFEGRDVHALSPKELRAVRGGRVGMVFQEPMTSLNPAMRIRAQLEEGLVKHCRVGADERHRLMTDMLRRVGIGDVEQALRAYPHEFSGGMRQRIMLASVMLLKPALLIADEPTTALDAVVQKEVVELMVGLARTEQTAVLMISHDLSMVARYTDRVIVMSQGEVVEQGPTAQLMAAPQHPYTRKLLDAMPRRLAPKVIAPAPRPLVEVKGLTVDYAARSGAFRKGEAKRALHGIDLAIQPGEVLAVVGGSGSGKTTLGRAIAGLLSPSGGGIRFDGMPVGERGQPAWRDYRLNCQMVFQDPYSSLDPRMTIAAAIGESLRHLALTAARQTARVDEALEEVGLAASYRDRYPHELSGGQRQRVAIARAVARRPRFVIADEPVSALDMTVRAQVLDLFADLQARHGFACMFISHDLAVVEQVADRVVVMEQGRIVEQGSRDEIFDSPRHDYTRTLLSAIPALEPTGSGGVKLRWRLAGESAGVLQRQPGVLAQQVEVDLGETLLGQPHVVR